MSGFSTVIGFMFSFFILIFAFTGVFIIYNQQISEQTRILESTEKNSLQDLNYDYSIESFFYMSGRLYSYLNNTGSSPIFYKYDNSICFSSSLDNYFISSNDNNVNLLRDITKDYSFVEKNALGIHLSNGVDISGNHSYKLIDCNGKELDYSISNDNVDWWNGNWLKRKIINISNPSSQNLVDYQILLNLNSSNVDFGLLKEDEVRFLLPLKELLVLDLTLDDDFQSIVDYSKFSHISYLGLDNGVGIDDPVLVDGVVFNALEFDGVNDLVRIPSSNNLMLDKSMTITAWVKWNGSGDSLQNIYTNGVWKNALRIVNDGGINDSKVLFSLEIDGTIKNLYSNITLDNTWHFLTATYDGGTMKLYVDGNEVGSLIAVGEISTGSGDNYIGSEGTGFYFNGIIDEVKVFAVDLLPSEVKDLYYNNLRFRKISYYVSSWNLLTSESKIYVKIPSLLSDMTLSLHMYYDNRIDELNSDSNFQRMFSYDVPRTVGYVVSDIATSGLSILSLYDNNTVYVGSNSFDLDELQSTSLGSANIYDKVKMKFLANVEGNNQGGEIISPISWAGTEFYYSGLRSGVDEFCMVSPWGIANYEIYDGGILENQGTVGSSGVCVTNDITTSASLRISSDIPILVSYNGNGQDSFPMYPATSESLYGIPSNTMYVGSGPLGANVNYLFSDSSISSQSLSSYGYHNLGGNGQDGNSPALRITSDNPIGAIQQADSDGTESSVFVPEYEFGYKFGSIFDMQYLTALSLYSNANCTLYDSSGLVDMNIALGLGGGNGLYKYDVNVGSDVLYLSGPWKFECDKPVWLYFEKNTPDVDETNLFGHMQMRQYIYPEPVVSIS